MRWDIFSSLRKEKASPLRDEIRNHIKAIEQFAPRLFKRERQIRYYNYEMLDEYLKPLHALFLAIRKGRDLARRGEAGLLVQALCFPVKGFHDPKGKLSIDQAIQHRDLRHRLRYVLLLFYNLERITDRETLSYLEERREIEQDPGQEGVG